MDVRDLEALRKAVEHDLSPESMRFPGGWPNSIELALLDAVLSINAKYGNSPNTGVRKRVAEYKASVGGSSWDQLARLAGLSEEELLPITGRQMTGGQSKAAAIIEAAGRLVGAGVTRSDDFRVDSPVQQEAYTGVKGLGPVTWTYLGMLLGHSGVKADRMICRYVSDAVGHDVDPSDAAVLVTEVAASLGKSASELDHAIWTFQRRRKGEK